eukprot:2590278-Lingulodinium_polyedra.AAC.1
MPLRVEARKPAYIRSHVAGGVVARWCLLSGLLVGGFSLKPSAEAIRGGRSWKPFAEAFRWGQIKGSETQVIRGA